jgi:hypothetical protein
LVLRHVALFLMRQIRSSPPRLFFGFAKYKPIEPLRVRLKFLSKSFKCINIIVLFVG